MNSTTISGALLTRTSAVALAFGLAISNATPPAGAERVPADHTRLVDSATLTTRAVVSGVVVTDDGEPSGEGVVVQLVAHPSEAERAKMKIGDERPVDVVGYARTDRDGRFALRISDEETARSHADENGNVDYELISFLDGKANIQAISLAAPGESFANRAAATVDSRSLDDVELRPVIDGAPRAATSRTAESDALVTPMAGCVQVFDKSLGKKRVTVGGGSTVSGAKMDFTYTTGSTSSVGVGYTSSLGSGSWSQSGTSSLTTSSEVEFATVASGSREFKTEFVFSQYETVCTGWGYFTVKATSHAGGSYPLGVGVFSVKPSNCVSHTGGSFTKYTSTASEYTSGALLAGAIGINLSSRTGYSSATKIKFTFSGKKKLCGKSGLPGGSPGLLRAMNP